MDYSKGNLSYDILYKNKSLFFQHWFEDVVVELCLMESVMS